MNLMDATGWTLIHFVWQGALIAVFFGAALVILRRGHARARYCAGCVAMSLMLIFPLATFTMLRSALPATIPVSEASAGAVARGGDYFFVPVCAWLCGVAALGIRAAGGWLLAERFARRGTSAAEPFLAARLAALANALGVSKPVRLAVSAVAQVPAVVGWIRPVILMPAGVLTGMSAQQIDALLAHELAHIRRHDYLINLLQTAAETLLFFHPAVWWVSRIIREEREHCCDDIAVTVCASAAEYVRALTDLDQIRRANPRLAMAANGGSLLSRAQRLLGVEPPARSVGFGWVAGIAVMAVFLVAAVAPQSFAQRPEPAPAPLAAPAPETPATVVAAPVPKPADSAPKRPDAGKEVHAPNRPDADRPSRKTDLARTAEELERMQFDMSLIQDDLKRQAAEIRRRLPAPADELDRLKAGIEGLDVARTQVESHGDGVRAAELDRLKAEIERLRVLQTERLLQETEQVRQQSNRLTEPSGELDRLKEELGQLANELRRLTEVR